VESARVVSVITQYSNMRVPRSYLNKEVLGKWQTVRTVHHMCTAMIDSRLAAVIVVQQHICRATTQIQCMSSLTALCIASTRSIASSYATAVNRLRNVALHVLNQLCMIAHSARKLLHTISCYAVMRMCVPAQKLHFVHATDKAVILCCLALISRLLQLLLLLLFLLLLLLLL
jgi:hypothetical protein